MKVRQRLEVIHFDPYPLQAPLSPPGLGILWDAWIGKQWYNSIDIKEFCKPCRRIYTLIMRLCNKKIYRYFISSYIYMILFTKSEGLARQIEAATRLVLYKLRSGA